ncbi:MAG: hypothetical protein ACYTHM_16800 [Planctomycetota bacterium]
MKSIASVYFVLALGCLVVSCGGGKEEGAGGDGGKKRGETLSPTDTVKGFLEAFRKGGNGFPEGKNYLSEKSVKFYEALIKEEGEEAFPEVVNYLVKAESAEGETVKVPVKGTYIKGGEQKMLGETFILKMEGGAWKIFQYIGEDGKVQDFEAEWDKIQKKNQ